MPDPSRDALGRLVVDPAKLPREAQIVVLRAASGKLQAFDDLALRWLGRTLGAALRGEGSLDVMLGLRPPRGSRNTPRALARRAAADSALARLAAAVDSQCRASRILRGTEATPANVASLVAELHALHAPTSLRAIADAVRRARR